MNTKNARILVIGAGVNGSICAVGLYRAGFDVTVLARAKRYEELDKSVKKRLKDIPKALVGSFAILGRAMHRNAYSVEPSDYWQVGIKKIGGDK